MWKIWVFGGHSIDKEDIQENNIKDKTNKSRVIKAMMDTEIRKRQLKEILLYNWVVKSTVS